jgi:hypothetical protein
MAIETSRFGDRVRGISESLERLHEYCRREGYKGWDNFDGLNSSLFMRLPFRRSAALRLGWIQFFKHSPVNFRRVALVPKGYNPKGLALFVSGLVRGERCEEAGRLAEILEGTASRSSSGVGWGYNFDWQSRGGFTPAGTPNIVTTTFASNALLDLFQKTGEGRHLDAARSSCRFLLEDLVLHEDRDSLCLGYIPGSSARVHNANMLGASLLARVYRLTGERVLLDKSRKAMAYSVRALRADASWPYGELVFHKFVDSFHTGFNLVSLGDWMDHAGEDLWRNELRMAHSFYLDTFWLDDGCPRYYHDATYPVDIHCSAQGIITCLKLARHDERSVRMARKIADWAIANMQDNQGFFYYQKTRLYTNRISYMRWSNAWMFYALSLLLEFMRDNPAADSCRAA